MAKISVVIPSIPPRRAMLTAAIESVAVQDHPVEAIHIAFDNEKRGAALNRDAAFEYVDTEWVAFLDDDDTMKQWHLRTCLMAAESSGADLLYPWFDMNKGGTDPFPFFFGKPWDDADPHQIPVTFVAKTDVIRAAGGFSRDWPPTPDDPEFDELGNRAGEDYRLVLRLVAMGAKIVHHPERTWTWNHHGRNTSGLPSRW